VPLWGMRFLTINATSCLHGIVGRPDLGVCPSCACLSNGCSSAQSSGGSGRATARLSVLCLSIQRQLRARDSASTHNWTIRCVCVCASDSACPAGACLSVRPCPFRRRARRAVGFAAPHADVSIRVCPSAQVRNALAVAKALGRALVVAPMWCGVDNTGTTEAHNGVSLDAPMQLPYKCPMDQVFYVRRCEESLSICKHALLARAR
jgi:hypothetical protein